MCQETASDLGSRREEGFQCSRRPSLGESIVPTSPRSAADLEAGETKHRKLAVIGAVLLTLYFQNDSQWLDND